jgi:hypothetical protein
MYNALPTLAEADERFHNCAAVLAAATKLLDTYSGKLGMCLVHAHCSINDDKIMLAKGRVSEPMAMATIGAFYPEHLLLSGQPYEFTIRPTEELPAELLTSFRRITGKSSVLGLYYAADAADDVGLLVEHTEGRKNITEPLQDAGANMVPGQFVETA